MAKSAAIVKVDQLCVTYAGGSRGLGGVSMRVGGGAAIAVMGANGSGKSTLVGAIAGLERFSGAKVSSGKIVLGDIDITRKSPWLRSQLGLQFVPGRGQVFPSLTVSEHLKLAGLKLDDLDVLPSDLTGSIRGVHKKRAGDLSGGQRQLLAIACAVLRHPKVLLVDEFSTGLSPRATATVLEALMWARTSMDLALIVVEQTVGVARELADDAIVLRQGMVAWEGSSSELSPRLVVEGHLDDSIAALTRDSARP